jgi:hypothetical protein
VGESCFLQRRDLKTGPGNCTGKIEDVSMNHCKFASTNALPATIALATTMALLLGMPLAGQTSPASAKARATPKTWTPSHTPDGQPDLQGFWTNSTLTPLERPKELAGKSVFTEEEAVEYQKRLQEQADEAPPGLEAGRAIGAFWFERGNVVAGRRTSLIVDPPDGRVPPLTPAAQKQVAARARERNLHPTDGPEDRSLPERCLLWPSAGPPMLPTAYNSNYQIVQGPGYVAILVEMIHDARIIPLDSRPHPGSNIRQWLGDSSGRWDGNTLTVDTTNFTGKTGFRGSGENLHLVERLTLTDPNTIRYEFTADDPATFTRSWKAEIPMRRTQGPIFEYACTEGNYALADILKGARAEEKRAAGESSVHEPK